MFTAARRARSASPGLYMLPRGGANLTSLTARDDPVRQGEEASRKATRM